MNPSRMCYAVLVERWDFDLFVGGRVCCLFCDEWLWLVYPWFVYPSDTTLQINVIDLALSDLPGTDRYCADSGGECDVKGDQY